MSPRNLIGGLQDRRNEMEACNAYKMDWDCKVRGCFNEKKRLKFAAFAECFPGKVNFTDVDAIVEKNGHVLMLEWKESPCVMEDTGQGIMFKRISQDFAICVLCVAGDAETMTVTHTASYKDGQWREWTPSDITSLRHRISKWCKRVWRR